MADGGRKRKNSRPLVRLQSWLKSRKPTNAAGLGIEQPAKHPEHLQNYVHPLLNLPDELLLLIAELLDQVSRALVSTSCRRLRVLLNSSLNLSLPDKTAKLRFLQYIELDHPLYLRCRSCGLRFKWEAERFQGYRCPRTNSHALAEKSKSNSWFIQGDSNVLMTREVVDLIFRAHRRGVQYGLPVSFLSTNGFDYNGVTRRNEARLVDGQLLLASRWEVVSKSREEMIKKARFFKSALCLHLTVNMWRQHLWSYVEQAITDRIFLDEPRLLKCPFCATDYELDMWNSNDRRITVALNVWRNFGQQFVSNVEYEQMFHSDPAVRTDANTLAQRNLCALFGSCRSDNGDGEAG